MPLAFDEEIDVSIELIVDTDETQSRAETSDSAVAQYQRDLEAGDKLPPIKLVRVAPDTYETADGHHTLSAFVQLGREVIPAVIAGGEPRDALAYGMTEANRKHGVNLSSADKRKRFEWLNTHEPWSEWTAKKLAPVIGVDRRTVDRWRKSPPGQSEGGQCPSPQRGASFRVWDGKGRDPRPAWLIEQAEPLENVASKVQQVLAIMEEIAADPERGAYVSDKISRIRTASDKIISGALALVPLAVCPRCHGAACEDCKLGVIRRGDLESSSAD